MRWLSFIFLAGTGAVFGQDLSVSQIPEDLKKDAKAIVRYDDQTLEILSANESVFTRKYAITIHHGQKRSLAHVRLPYNSFSEIQDIVARVLDGDGREIRKLKKKDIQDISLFDGVSMVNDSRAKYFNLEHYTLPFTIEVSYSEQNTGSLFYPRWIPVGVYETSLERASFTLVRPAPYTVRHMTRNAPGPDSSTVGDQVRLTWQVENLPVFKSESFSGGLTESAPHVTLAANDFEIEGLRGSMSTWKDLGLWINALNQQSHDPPESLKAKVREITGDAATNEEKIAAIYRYLQGTTRYVGIQLGIGGWKPFDVSHVYDHKYGDCKALSFYTKAMLEEAGITAHYALIRAGYSHRDLDEAFPSAHFNHAIVCVPNDGDTVWLECTSQTNPFGYQGTFTGNRKALLITPEGGVLANTRKYGLEENVQVIRSEVVISETGDAEMTLSVALNGMEIENHRFDRLVGQNRETQQEWLLDYLDQPTLTLRDYKLELNGAFPQKGSVGDPVGNLTVSYTSANLAKRSGKRLILGANQFSRFPVYHFSSEPRKTDVSIRYPYRWVDTVRFVLPENYHPELLPKPAALSTRYGTYSREITADGGELVYVRKLEMYSGRYPKEEFESFRAFIETITKLDHEKVIVIDKT